MKQPNLKELEESLKSKDPLDIVNAFIVGNVSLDEYWQHRLCCLAEMIVNKNEKKSYI